MDVRILGSLEVIEDGRDLAPQRAKPRAVLGLLALHANAPLSTDRLVEALWGDEPPPTADKAIQGHVSALRKALGASRIRTEGRGYRLVLEPGELDADRFRAAVAEGRAAATAVTRANVLAEALRSWRGSPLPELAASAAVAPELARLESLRLDAIEDHAAAELEMGHHGAVLAELERLLESQPFRERLRALVMLALYRAGRQSDALRAYRDGRRLLAEELGIDPGAELQELERRILAQDPGLEPPTGARPPLVRQERKTVTVLVAEAVPDRLVDPEDLERVAGPARDRVRAVIERLGGRAEPLFANAVLGIFGAPRAHEDDPLRAVRAALELRSGGIGDGFEVRCGIEAGDALVTIDGARLEVTGEVLTLAARLQAQAAPGSVVVGSAVRRRTETSIEYRALRGDAWEPVGPRAATEVPRTPDAPLVGRADELALLEHIYARASEPSVQLVTLAAEPGGGKSRLVRELGARLEAAPSPPVWHLGRCLPYGDGVTYWALGEIVRAQAGILESDDAPTSAAKLAAAVAAVEPDESRRIWLEGALAGLVGLEGAAPAGPPESGFAAWRQFIEGAAADGPLVLVFEDIHWAVDALLEFIEYLVAHAGPVPLLVVCTARLELLETRPGWAGGLRNATTIALAPLSEADTERLLRSLIGRTPKPATIRHAGGNPLFAHELARMIERTGDESDAAIPESLQAVIAARLDTLAPEVKAAAADAAVVGEVFWPGAIGALGGLDDREADARLGRLVANDVARRRRSSTVAREDEYAFLHALVRDVAYGQIPRRDRIAKHRSAAAWIERLAGDRPTSHAELVAHHYRQALQIADALAEADTVAELRPLAQANLVLAGDGARSLDARRAETFYRAALDLTDAGDPGRGTLLARLGEVAQLTGRLDESERLCREAIAELAGHGDRRGAGEAMGALATTLWRLGRPESERRRLAAEAIATLEPLAPGPELVRAYSHMAMHELHAGKAGQCGTWARKALALADRLGLLALQVTPLHLLGIARFESGDEDGIADVRRAVALGIEAGLTLETTSAHSNLAAILWVTDGPLAALSEKRAAAEFALSRGLLSLELTIRAESLWQLFDAGHWDDALASTESLLGTDAARVSNRVATMARTVRARILAERGRFAEAAELERAFLPRARDFGDPQDLGPALAAGAALRFAAGDAPAAVELAEEFAKVTRGRDPSQRVHELPLLARVCRAAGRMAVVEALIPARRVPTYRRARICLVATRAVIHEARGDLQSAAVLHAEAASAWRAFGCPLEEGHSLVGLARALRAVDRANGPDGAADAEQAAERARAIAGDLSATQLAAEAERVLA